MKSIISIVSVIAIIAGLLSPADAGTMPPSPQPGHCYTLCYDKDGCAKLNDPCKADCPVTPCTSVGLNGSIYADAPLYFVYEATLDTDGWTSFNAYRCTAQCSIYCPTHGWAQPSIQPGNWTISHSGNACSGTSTQQPPVCDTIE